MSFASLNQYYGDDIYSGYGTKTKIKNLFVVGMPDNPEDTTETFTGGSKSVESVVDHIAKQVFYG